MIRMRFVGQIPSMLVLFLLLVTNTNVNCQPMQDSSELTTVKIFDFKFDPQNLTLRKCDTINWTNNDSVIHSLWFVRVGDKSTYILSPPIMPGESWSHTFNEAITLQYYSFEYKWVIGFLTISPPITEKYNFKVTENSMTFNVVVVSNSTIYPDTFDFSKADMKLYFNVSGCSGDLGYSNVTIPKGLLKDNPWIVKLDGEEITDQTIRSENETHSSISFTYIQSTHLVEIMGTWAIPEFPVTNVLPLITAASLITIILGTKKILGN